MKVKFETNLSKIRNKDVYEKALHIIEEETKQGFFRAKGETVFKLFREDSLAKDAKFVELHIVKVYGKGEYKFNGNLSYNQATKEIKFYVLSVVEFDNFNYDDEKMAEFLNVRGSEEEDLAELRAVLEKIEKNRPPYQPRQGGNNGRRPGGNNRGGYKGGGQRNGGGPRGNNGGSSNGGNNRRPNNNNRRGPSRNEGSSSK